MANTKFDSKRLPQAYCLKNCKELIGIIATKKQLLELLDKKTSERKQSEKLLNMSRRIMMWK
jgi:hypothetical protein